MSISMSNIVMRAITLGNTAPVPTDPYYGNVSLLLHFDGTNGSTVYTDNSLNNFSISGANGAALTTSIYKYGTASGNFTATTDSRVVTPTSSALKLVGDFTVEMWYSPSLVQPGTYLGGCLNTSHLWFNLNGGSNIEFYALGNQQASSIIPTVGNWYHLAISRSSGVIRNFVNGIQQGGNSINAVNMGNSAQWSFGAAPQLAGFGTGGRCYLDDVRITNGIGRYTTNFTPPAAAFPNS